MLQRGDCVIMQRSENAQIADASPDFQTITVYVTPEFIQMAMPLSNYGTRGHMMLFNDPVMHLNARQAKRCKEYGVRAYTLRGERASFLSRPDAQCRASDDH